MASFLPAALAAQVQPQNETIVVNAKGQTTPFPHFWEEMFGSGRAILSLRDSYRQDMRAVKKVTDFKYVRFHNIFHDEVGLYNVDANGKPFYNYSYVDQIYDGLLANGVRPFVELSFMPEKLTSDAKIQQGFWYHPNIAPPKSYALWDDMTQHFVRHLVERYGIDEVSQWYFEVWNEPNIGFWGGKPEQSTYYELYDHTARDVKSVSPRLKVGGPATAQAAWVGDFLRHAEENHIPVDFVSSHVYGNDSSKDVFHSDENIPRDEMVCRAVKKVHDEIVASPMPHVPFILSEFNASFSNEPDVTDSIYMGPWMADTIRRCAGMVDMMSYWTFSDVFEEQGVVKTPFYGGFGLIAADNIPKPAYNAFAMLHELGNKRIQVSSDSALVTKRADGKLAIALWNYAAPYGIGAKYTPPPATLPASKHFTVHVEGAPRNAAVKLWRLDADHGNVIKTYDAMGRPAFPSRQQIEALKKAGQLPPAESLRLRNGTLHVDIPAQGLVVFEVGQ
ncbi:MAG: GH39 family glycosyl hydrolase [Acidobacteriaceae bacterium]